MSETHFLENPILPGFYPDPSCIRVGDTFYLINSSFQFFPGLPIHTSTNLVDWTLIGHAICRTSQLSLNDATTKLHNESRGEIFTAGLYAPTIRYHAGKFYIVCTILTGKAEMAWDEDFRPSNFIISCDDLTNPDSYSDPVYFDFHGIDPSLLFDDDGKVYMQGSYMFGYRKSPATVIRQAEIDLETGEYLSDVRDIWPGSGGKVPEGPHVYKKNGVYWLLIAEGGTHRGHSITMARSSSVWGPYESCEANPVLTRHEVTSIIQCVGHGELFNDSDGRWWACLLARREYGGSFPLGRETFMIPVTWSDGEFPEFPNVELRQPLTDGRSVLRTQQSPSRPHQVRMVTPSSLYTLYLRSPDLNSVSLSPGGETLLLKCTEVPLDAASGAPTFIGQRQTSLESSAHVVLNLTSLPENSHCGLSLYKDTYRHVSLNVDSAQQKLSLAVLYPQQEFAHLNSQSIADTTSCRLTIKSSTEKYFFSVELLRAGQWTREMALGEIPAAAMSGDDFTGTVYGIYANGLQGSASFTHFQIEE